MIFPIVLAFAQAISAQQIPRADSLNAVGFKFLDAYAESHDLADARNAHRAFSEVLKKSPNDSRAHLGLGLAYAAVEKQQLDPLTVNDATKPVNNTMAVRHLIAALSGGSDAAAAARALVTIARREYDVMRMQDAIAGLEKSPDQNEVVRTAVAELYISMYDAPRAERAVLNATSAGARRSRAIARLLQPAKVEAGGADYLEALAAADSSALEEFVRDARWLADPEEAAQWKKMSRSELPKHLITFWQRRAATAGVSPGQRLATHFTRVQHAMQEFSFYRQRNATPQGIYIDPQMDALDYDVDDRAFTYVRYGEPDDRIETRDGDFPYNQTWVYRRTGDKPLYFEYFLMGAHGWALAGDVVRCAGGSLPYSEQYLRDRMSLDPRFGLLLTECTQNTAHRPDPSRVQGVALPFARERRDTMERAVIRDHGVPKTKRVIPLLADVVQFRGDGDRNDVTAVITWPFNALQQSNGIVRLRLTFDVTDTITGKGSTRDTTVMFRATADAATGRMYLRMPLDPGRDRVFHVRANDLNDDSVVTIVGEPVEIRPLSGSDLRMSDVALVGGKGGSWLREGQALSLLPRGVSSRSFAVYYELYNVAPGARYKTTVSFDPLDYGLADVVKKLKGKQVVTFSFDAENASNEHVVRELRALQSELPAGNYRLSVSVVVDGKTVRQSRIVTLPDLQRS